MLSDSKAREVGFIRTNSSRKLLHQAESSNRPSSNEDSFSSFEQQNLPAMPFKPRQSPGKNVIFEADSVKNIILTRPGPQIPKPKKKTKKQPQFQNQRLKNNFFQEPSDNTQIKQKDTKKNGQVNTFNFNNQYIDEVNNICNRMGMVKLQANFSFNPKHRHFKQQLDAQPSFKNQAKTLNYLNQIPPKNFSMNQQKNYKEAKYFQKKTTNFQLQDDFQTFSSSQESQNDKKKSVYQENQALCYDENQKKKKSHSHLRKSLPQATNTEKLKKPSMYQKQQNQAEYKQKLLQTEHTRNQLLKNFKNKHCKMFYNESVENMNPIYNQPIKKNPFSNENQQKLIVNHNKNDFGIRFPQKIIKFSQKELQSNQTLSNPQKNDVQSTIISTNGGLCFNIDIKQFNEQADSVDEQPKKKVFQPGKKKKVNQKEQILKRRQMAKVYSKKSRFKLFGFS